MPKKYNEDEFLNKIKDREQWEKGELYQQCFVNYKGRTSDSNKIYNEILAEKLYNDELEINIKEIDKSKEKESNSPIHNKEDVKFTNYEPEDVERTEENIAKRMFQIGSSPRQSDEYVVADYQVPVNRVHNTSDGKIDLILTTSSSIVIGEIKGNESKESLIRTILEVETYFRKISHEKLRKCYNKENIEKAILLFKDTRPFEEFSSNDYIWVKKLLDKWDISILLVESTRPMDQIFPQENNFNLTKIN